MVSSRTLGQIDKITNLSANTRQQHESRKVRRTSMPSIFVRPTVYLLGSVLVCCYGTLVNVAWSAVMVNNIFSGFSVTFRTVSGSGGGRRGRERKFRPRDRGLELLRRTGRPEVFGLRYDFLGPWIPGPVYWLLGKKTTLIKKKRKFFSFIKKFRMDRVQSHIPMTNGLFLYG